MVNRGGRWVISEAASISTVAPHLGAGGLVVFTEDEEDANDQGTDVKSTINGWIIPTAQLAP